MTLNIPPQSFYQSFPADDTRNNQLCLRSLR